MMAPAMPERNHAVNPVEALWIEYAFRSIAAFPHRADAESGRSCTACKPFLRAALRWLAAHEGGSGKERGGENP